MTDPTAAPRHRSAAPLAVVLLLFLAVAGLWALAPGSEEGPGGRVTPTGAPTSAAKGPEVTFAPPPPAPAPGGPDVVALPPASETPAPGPGPVGHGVATPAGPGGPMKGFAPGKDPVDPDAPENAATGVRGRVVTTAGAAVEGARVQLRGQKPGPQGMTMMMMKPGPDGEMELVVQGETRSREATTGADGTFEVRGLDASFRYDLHVTPPAGLLKARAKGPALKAGQVVDAGDVAVKRAGAIEGTVTGPDGRPIEHARVALGGDGPFLGGPPGEGEAGGAKFTMARRAVRVGGPAPGGDGDGPPLPMFGRATKTDAQGRYRFDEVAPGEQTLTATAKGLRAGKRTTTVAEGDTSRGVDLRLADGLALTVRVQDAGGAPIAKATVRVMAGFGGPGGAGVAAETDASGQARLAGLQSSEVTLAVTAAGFAAHTADLALGPGDPDTPRVVVLQPGGAVTGRLVREDGSPVVKAMVFLEPLVHGPDVDIQMGDDGRPDAQGRFRLNGVRPGDWKLRVQAPGLAPRSVTVKVAGAAPVDLSDVKLEALRAIPVLVLDPDGAPVADAVVDAGQGGRGMMVIAVKAGEGEDAPPMVVARSARSGPDGRARIEGLEPGSFTLRATKAGYADGWAEATVGGEGSPAEVTVKLTRGGKVQVRVLAAAGEAALPPTTVHLTRRGRDAPVASQPVGPSGEAVFERVAPGDYRLAADGVPADEAAWFTVQDDRTASRTLQRAPQATLEGTVRGPDGAPLAGVPVALGMLDLWHVDEKQGLAFVSRRATTDAAGRYRFEGVRPDRWGLAVTAAGRTVAFAVDVRDPGLVTRDLRLPADAAPSTVALQVAGAAGPLAGARVTLERTDDGPVVRRERAADGEGRVRFEGVPAGDYSLTAVAAGHARARARLTVASGAQVEGPRLQLETGGALLLEVRPGGAPAGRLEARVRVRPVGSKDPLEQSFALVEVGGPPVRIDGLTPGAAYEVVASADGWRDARLETTCQGEPTTAEALLLQRE